MVQQCADGCCGNGLPPGERCDCISTSSGCGIRVRCFFPRSWNNLPTKEPHLIRIVRVDEDGEVISVVITTDDFDYIWNPPPGTTGTYRAEVCCFDPGPYDECRWTVVGLMTLSITADSCPLKVGIAVCISSPGSCGSSLSEQIRVYATARSNCKLTSLEVDGVDVLPDSAGDIHWVDMTDGCTYVGLNECGPTITWTHPNGVDNVKVNAFATENAPIQKAKWCVSATDACGNFRECCVDAPCWLTKNYLRIEVPTISNSTAEAFWTRGGGSGGAPFPTMAQVMDSTPCANHVASIEQAYFNSCGSIPDQVSHPYINSIRMKETFSVNISGGSYFFKRQPGASTPNICPPYSISIGTGSYSFEYEELGRRLKPTNAFINKLYDAGASHVRFGCTYVTRYFLDVTPGIGYKIRVTFDVDGNGYFDSNTYPPLFFDPAVSFCSRPFSYAGAIANSPLRPGSSPFGALFPAIGSMEYNGCGIPLCNQLRLCSWTVSGRKAIGPPNWVYDGGNVLPTNPDNRCGVTILALQYQNGTFIKPPFGTVGADVYEWFGRQTIQNQTDNVPVGNTYSEWVAL
jgi:hypothetical protein